MKSTGVTKNRCSIALKIILNRMTMEADEKKPILHTKNIKNFGTNNFASSEAAKSCDATLDFTSELESSGQASEVGEPDDFEESTRTNVLQLFQFASKKDIRLLFVGSICAIMNGASFPLLAVFFGKITDLLLSYDQEMINFNFQPDFSNSTEQNPKRPEILHQVLENSLILFYIGGASLLLSFIQTSTWEIASRNQIFRIRQELFYQILRQEISWHVTQRREDLANKLFDDTERILEGIGHKFSMVLRNISFFVAGIIVALFVTWRLTALICLITPILAATTALSGSLIVTQTIREQKKYGSASFIAKEVLCALKTVAAFSTEQIEFERYKESIIKGKHLAIKKYYSLSFMVAMIFFLIYAAYALVYWYGCSLIAENTISPGQLFTIFFSVMAGAFSIGNTIPFVTTMKIAQGAASNVFKIIKSIPAIDPFSKEGILPEQVFGEINFVNVEFKYFNSSQQILKNINLKISSGSTVAIVGQSGEGKSTIIELLLRFYEADEGVIFIDGNDIRALNLAWLRFNVCYVPQVPSLFEVTIRENIRYGREEASFSDIVEASKMADAHEFITKLPRGYDTVIVGSGSQLSSGQKQKISLARAFVRKPKILILDEATSLIDGKSEEFVRIAIERAGIDCTTIIIAHRLSTVKRADVIHVLKNGRIIESGSHDQLMMKEEEYYKLVHGQLFSEEMEGYLYSTAQDSGDESVLDSFYQNFRQLKVRKLKSRRRRDIRRSFRNALPDYHKARIIEEMSELKIEKAPSSWDILRHNRQDCYCILLGSFGSILTGCITPIFAFIFSEIYSTLRSSGSDLIRLSRFWSLMFIALAVFSSIAMWMRTFFIAKAGEELTVTLRLKFFQAILRQPILWFDRKPHEPAKLLARLSRDAPLVKAAAGHRISVILYSTVMGLVGVTFPFLFNWQLALGIVATIPILVTAAYVQILVQKPGSRKDSLAMQEAGKFAYEAIYSIHNVQALGIERIFLEKFIDHLITSVMESRLYTLYYALIYSISDGIIIFLYAASFLYGSYLMNSNLIQPLSLYRVLFCVAFCSMGVGQMIGYVPDYSKAKAAGALIFHFLKQKSSIDPLNCPGLKTEIQGSIELKNVHFQYPERPSVSVLQGISFSVPAGSSFALVGASGCGKSTIAYLLLRFYELTSGQIMIDGIDIRSLSIDHLRRNIGIVMNESTMFNGSIRSNIVYGLDKQSRKNIPEEEIIKAAKQANIHDFICSLPQRYNTIIGAGGLQLSSGQRQRIAISRALIRNPKILIFDEATSAVDAINEELIQKALEEVKIGRTCLIIAHRMSTVLKADCIGVIRNGKIKEIGTHSHLISKKGLYYQLMKTQKTH